MRRLWCILLICLIGRSLTFASATDSLRVSPWPGIAAGAALTGISAAARQAYPHSPVILPSSPKSDRGMGYIRFVPIAWPWAMKAFGQPTRSSWGRMALSQGLSSVIMLGTVEGMKRSVGSVRPDGSDSRSFPSGHTAIAFMGASFMSHELGWRSGLYSLGAYALASAVAAERVIDGHHFPTDVMAGAGLGILSGELGYWIADRIFGERGLEIEPAPLTEQTNLSFLSLYTGLALPLGKIKCGGDLINRLPALSVGLRGGLAISDSWGLLLETGLLTTPLEVKSGLTRTYVKNLSAINAGIGGYYMHVLSTKVRLTAEAAAGYRFNLAIGAEDDAVTSGKGTPLGRLSIGAGLRLSPRFRCDASAGIELSGYKFTLKPSDYYSIHASATKAGATSALLFNISAIYDL